MASPKIPWRQLWQSLWKMIPDPLTDGRLLLALDDYINPKTGKKIFGCNKVFDHAAKQNQSRYPWAQNIVTIGLLKMVKGRWACLPLNWRFYHLKKHIENLNVFKMPGPYLKNGPGRPRKYGRKLGDASSLAAKFRPLASETNVNLYGRIRTVVAYEHVVMLKTLKCAVKVVWIYRKTQWVALFSTDLTLSVEQVIEYYGARWKIEAAFKELKQDIGSAETQTRHPNAVMNHLHFCMMATSVAWVYASRLEKTPSRRHVVNGRNHFAFSDVRRLVAQAAMDDNFCILFPVPRKSVVNSLVAVLLRIAA
jgi:hypothetical protein